MGLIVDRFPSKIMMPFGYALTGAVMMLFIYIDKPNSFFAFFVWILASLSYLFLILSAENFFSRNVPKEVRGMMFALLYFCA